MSELPEGWAEATLGDLIAPVETTDPSKSPTEPFTYVDIGSIDNASNSITDPKIMLGAEAPSRARRVIRSNDVLFSTVRTYLKNIARVPEHLDGQVTSTGIAVLRAMGEVDPGYLFRLVTSDDFIEEVSRSQDGTLYPATTDKKLAATRVPVAPAAEQKRIAAKIDSLTAKSARARSELTKIEALVERYKAAVLERAFRGALSAEFRALDEAPQTPVVGRLTSSLRIKYRRGAEADFIPPYEVPSSWRWLTMPQLGTLDRGKSKHRPRNDDRLFGGPYPFIQTGEVRSATQYVDEFTQTYSEFGLEQSKLWPRETVCITIAANIAETALLRFEACFPDSVVGFVADEGQIEPRYLEFFMRTMRAQLDQFAPATAQKNINLDVLAAVRIPTPPIEEQRLIVERIEAAFNTMDRLKSEANLAAEHAVNLDKAILQKAFEGRLVPQNPSDEPASALLERLRSISKPIRVQTIERARIPVAPRAHRRTSSMTKSRFDPDVAGKPYLSNLVTAPGSPVRPEELYQRAQLAMPDFYKQLAFEVDQGFLVEGPDGLMRRS